MRFWDTSAIIPLTIIEPRTQVVRPFVDEDPGIAVWWGTRVECVSAMVRRLRESQFRRTPCATLDA